MSGKEAGEGAPKLWILHSMRIKAIASAKVINLPVVLITTLLLFSHSAIRVFSITLAKISSFYNHTMNNDNADLCRVSQRISQKCIRLKNLQWQKFQYKGTPFKRNIPKRKLLRNKKQELCCCEIKKHP